MATALRRMSRLAIAEQSDLGTINQAFARSVPIGSASTITELIQDHDPADVIGKQSAWGDHGPPERASNQSQVVVQAPLNLQEIQLALLSGFVGNVTSTADADTDAEDWTFSPNVSLTARTAVDYFTFQAETRDAAGGVATVDIPKVFLESLVITVPPGDGLVQTTQTYRGGKMIDPGSDRDAATTIIRGNYVSKRSTGFAVYDNWAAAVAATTPASGRAISGATITIPTGLTPADNLGANSDLDYDAVDFTPMAATITGTVYDDPATAGFVAQERVHKENGDLRFVKFWFGGSRTSHLGDAGTLHRLQLLLTMAMQHGSESLVARGATDSAGRMTRALNLRAAADTTQALGISMVLSNTVASGDYPAT